VSDDMTGEVAVLGVATGPGLAHPIASSSLGQHRGLVI
jgi:hypothetical protein